ncbi:MAG: NAD-dependent epimerase/dehydratase family protein [bacterium]
MKILITGGAGFIGSHLSDALIENGESVTVIDDLSSGSIENIKHLKTDPKFAYVLDTIMNKSVLLELVDEADIIFHLAAAVGVKMIVGSPVRTIETNIHGTELVLQCADKKKKPVIIASSSEVYGKNSKVPFKENDDLILGPTIKSRWSYGCSKAIDEFLALAYWKERKLPIIIARFFNTVGPRQTGRYGMVVPRFINQALKNEPITVYGDGRQIRCFAHVKDVVKAVIDLSNTSKAIGEIFNIGTDEEISIEDLAKKIKNRADSSSEIKYITYDEAYEAGFEDMAIRVPCLEKIRKYIDYQPHYSLEEILADTIGYIKSRQELVYHYA